MKQLSQTGRITDRQDQSKSEQLLASSATSSLNNKNKVATPDLAGVERSRSTQLHQDAYTNASKLLKDQIDKHNPQPMRPISSIQINKTNASAPANISARQQQSAQTLHYGNSASAMDEYQQQKERYSRKDGEDGRDAGKSYNDDEEVIATGTFSRHKPQRQLSEDFVDHESPSQDQSQNPFKRVDNMLIQSNNQNVASKQFELQQQQQSRSRYNGNHKTGGAMLEESQDDTAYHKLSADSLYTITAAKTSQPANMRNTAEQFYQSNPVANQGHQNKGVNGSISRASTSQGIRPVSLSKQYQPQNQRVAANRRSQPKRGNYDSQALLANSVGGGAGYYYDNQPMAANAAGKLSNSKLQHAQTAESSLIVLSNSKQMTSGSKGGASSNHAMLVEQQQHSATGQHQQYANTHYYMQHGSSLLNRSLKGQIRLNSSSSASQKNRIIQMNNSVDQLQRKSNNNKILPQQKLTSATTIGNKSVEEMLPDLNQESIDIATVVPSLKKHQYPASALRTTQQARRNINQDMRSTATAFRDRPESVTPGYSEQVPTQHSTKQGNYSVSPRRRITKGTHDLNLDRITPEMAAQIVKHFVLPMFDNSARARVSNRLGGNAAKHTVATSGQVYHELKLSEQLNNTLSQVRDEVQRLTGDLEDEVQRRTRLENQLNKMKLKMRQKDQELNLARLHLKKANHENDQMRAFVESMRQNNEVMHKISDFNQRMRRRYQLDLQESKSKLEAYHNHTFELCQNKVLYNTKYQVLEENFILLFKSIEQIANAKAQETKFKFQMQVQQDRMDEMNKETLDLHKYVRETTLERDYYMKETQGLIEKRQRLETQYAIVIEQSKKVKHDLEREMKLTTDKANDYFEKNTLLEKEKKNLIIDREKMKERVKKLKMRRGKIDDQEKVCKNCGKDYIESENYNWSCRTHRSEWSGEIWWCCGKNTPDAPGCKYSKHESKEDEDEDGLDVELKTKNNAKIRCHCCKELGHTIEECPRDPNIRSKVDTELDYERIQKIKDYRKLHADTVVTTTQFLKKCVIVPNKPATEIDEKKIVKANPFKRGSMQFDDFNYDQYNPYILVEEDKKRLKRERKEQIRQFGASGRVEIQYEVDKKDLKSIAHSGLSEEALQNHQLENYVFGSLSVKTPQHFLMQQNDDSQTPMGTEALRKSHDGRPGGDMTGAWKNAIMKTLTASKEQDEDGDGEQVRKKMDMAELAKLALGGGDEAEENKNEVEFEDKQEGTQGSNPSERNEKTEEDQDEDDSTVQAMLTDEEQQVQIYYDKDEIAKNFEYQQQDHFEDLINMKAEVTDPMRNGINILDHLPNNMQNPKSEAFRKQKEAEELRRRKAAEAQKAEQELQLSDDDDGKGKEEKPLSEEELEKRRVEAELAAQLQQETDFHNLEAKYLNNEIDKMISKEKRSPRKDKKLQKQQSTEEQFESFMQASIAPIDTHGKFTSNEDHQLYIGRESKDDSDNDSDNREKPRRSARGKRPLSARGSKHHSSPTTKAKKLPTKADKKIKNTNLNVEEEEEKKSGEGSPAAKSRQKSSHRSKKKVTELSVEEVDNDESLPAAKAKSRKLSARSKTVALKKVKKEEVAAEGEVGETVTIQDQSLDKKKKGTKKGSSRVVRRPSVMRPPGGWM